MQGLNFKWNKAKKEVGTSGLFVGTSPAFDFAIFSVCALAIFLERLTEYTCELFKTTLRIRAEELVLKSRRGNTRTGRVNTAYPRSVIGKLNMTLARDLAERRVNVCF